MHRLSSKSWTESVYKLLDEYRFKSSYFADLPGVAVVCRAEGVTSVRSRSVGAEVLNVCLNNLEALVKAFMKHAEVRRF